MSLASVLFVDQYDYKPRSFGFIDLLSLQDGLKPRDFSSPKTNRRECNCGGNMRPTSSIVKRTANMRRALVANQVGVVWAKTNVDVEKIDVNVDCGYVDACGKQEHKSKEEKSKNKINNNNNKNNNVTWPFPSYDGLAGEHFVMLGP